MGDDAEGAALRESPSDDVTVRVLDGLNHLFQPAETDLRNEYAPIEITMTPRALKTVSGCVRERTQYVNGSPSHSLKDLPT